MKHLAVVFFTCILSVSAHAYYSGAWGRLTLRLPVTDRWTTDAEVQHVRQSGYAGSTPFDYPLLFSYRHWVHYRPSQKVAVSLSPFAWFRANPIIHKPADHNVPAGSEFRFTAAIKSEAPIALNLSFEYRTALEYRMLFGQDIVRCRERLALKYRIKNKWLLMPAGELLLNMTGVDRSHIFDQWRGSADVAHNLLRNRLTASLGYMYLSRLPATASRREGEHYGVVRMLYNLGSGRG